MKLIPFYFVTSLVIFCSCKPIQTLVVEPEVIAVNRTKIESGDAFLSEVLTKLVHQADSIINLPVRSVIEKNAIPPSGDKNDYLSRGTYWWPNPETSTGLPYIRKDGQINPEVSGIRDFHYMIELNNSIKVLGLAYYYTQDDKYVINALERLRTWFLNPSTKMNPNLNHSQVIPGVSDGRADGLIDTRTFIDLIDGIQLMSTSIDFPKKDLDGLKMWFKDYLEWMTTSDIGVQASEFTNNIGTAYYMQVLAYSLFTGDKRMTHKTIKGPIDNLIDVQFDSEGKQVEEISRTRSWNYTLANLSYWFTIARLSEHVGINLWDHRTASGKSIRSGYEWTKQFADGQKWPYQQITRTDFSKSFSQLRTRGEKKYRPRSNQGQNRRVNSRTMDFDISPVTILEEGVY